MKDKKFLNELAPDKFFLEQMVKKLSLLDHLKTPVQDTVLQEVQKKKFLHVGLIEMFFKLQATETLGFLIDRRDFWSQQNPDHYEENSKTYAVHPSWKELIRKIVKQQDVERLADEFNIFDLL